MLLFPTEKLCLLEEVEILSPLPRESLAELARRARSSCYRDGELIVCEGDLAPKLHLLVTGRAVVLRSGRHVTHLSRWECFGELALFLRRPHEVSVLAETEVVVLSIARDDLTASLRKRPDAAYEVLESVTRMLRARLQLPAAASW